MTSKEKYLKKVFLDSDVHATCLQHALSTEKEEVMGLLIGEIDEVELISKISASVILHRSDKQPDRVEISPEQLCAGTMYAEELANKLKKPLRVVGWYHSHPHITVWPSHVDLRTQAMYQTMDNLFVGLIYSVYQSVPGSFGNRMQVTCFQADLKDSDFKRKEVPLVIKSAPMRAHNLEAMASLPKILAQEELQSHEGEGDNSTEDPLATLHNDALNILTSVHTVSEVAKPLYEDLVARLEASKIRIAQLEKMKEELSKKTF